jgi:putative chitinase
MFPDAAKSKLDLTQVAAAFNHKFADPSGLSTIERRAAFLGQLAHESAFFTAVSENLNYSSTGLLKTFKKYFPTKELADKYARKPVEIGNRVYADRMGNGNEASGDGYKFRGRGFIQLTGKNNYKSAGLDLKVDLLANPDYAITPQGAVDTALWFWNKNSLNGYADREDIRGMTKAINGGFNGLDERIANIETAKRILST